MEVVLKMEIIRTQRRHIMSVRIDAEGNLFLTKNETLTCTAVHISKPIANVMREIKIQIQEESAKGSDKKNGK